MAAIQSLRTGLSALGRNPVLFLGGLLYGLVVLPQNATILIGATSAAPLLQIVTFFVTPFIIAGLIGMAGEALDGDTTLGTFARIGRARYVSLLAGKFVEFGISVLFVVLFVVVALASVVALGIGFSAGSGVASGGSMLVAAGIVALLVLAALLVVFFIQFFPVAIAFDDADAIEGFKRSVSLVRSNLLSTLGYSVINFVVALVTALPVLGFTFYRAFSRGFPQPSNGGPGAAPGPGGGFASGGVEMGAVLSTTEMVAVVLVSLALTAFLVAFRQAYATAFYRRHSASIEDRVLNDTP